MQESLRRSDIINKLIAKYKYESYLEIGVANPQSTFEKIIALKKTGVDPRTDYHSTYQMTSDSFFEQNKEDFDIIFIDGLHHKDQVFRDIENSLHVLNDGGTIVCHDMSPPNEACQVVPQSVGEWCGDCWKAWMLLRFTRPDLKMFVVDTDYGVGVIQKGQQLLVPLSFDLSWENLVKNRKKWLNLKSIEEFKNEI